jgi:hypothetical protein
LLRFTGIGRADEGADRVASDSASLETPLRLHITCRLCGGDAAFVFKKSVLGRYTVSYFRCLSCDSIETEAPFWLDEAYAIPGVHIDVGIASRSVKNWAALVSLFEQIELPRDALIVDFGAASGLVARLVRDLGYNMRSYDKYSVPSFTSYFNADHPQQSQPCVVCAFEVFEHFVDPAAELAALLSSGPELIVFTTWFCDGQPDDWIYFVESCGQHIFFYSERAMRQVADGAGFDLVLTTYFQLLVRHDAPAAVRDGVVRFRDECQSLVHARVGPLFRQIEFGNEWINADFEAALRKFDGELRAQSGEGI